MKSEKWLFEKKTDRELQFWPNTSSEHYLSTPTLPKKLVKKPRRARISAPEPLPFNLLGGVGILNSAITHHLKDYYQSRAMEDFHVLVFTFAGEAKIRINKKTLNLKRGSVFVAPANTAYVCESREKWFNFWFHIEATKEWNSLFGSEPFVKKCARLHDLKYFVEMYLREVYSPARSLSILRVYAEAISLFIRSEFSVGGLLRSKSNVLFDDFFARLPDRISETITTLSSAKELGTTARKLDAECRKRFSKNFAKYFFEMRMNRAMALVETGALNTDDIARYVGFANKYSLSKAFKIRFGRSPVFFRNFGNAMYRR